MLCTDLLEHLDDPARAISELVRVSRFEHVIPMFECRRYKWFPPLKWLLWGHFKNSGTLGALLTVFAWVRSRSDARRTA